MSLLYYTSAISLELDASRCTGCGRCVEVCPHNVFAMTKVRPLEAGSAGRHVGPRLQASIVGRERCMECGACALNCAPGAIKAGAGVGCATAIINGLIRGTAPTCGCGGDGSDAGSCGGGTCCGGN